MVVVESLRGTGLKHSLGLLNLKLKPQWSSVSLFVSAWYNFISPVHLQLSRLYYISFSQTSFPMWSLTFFPVFCVFFPFAFSFPFSSFSFFSFSDFFCKAISLWSASSAATWKRRKGVSECSHARYVRHAVRVTNQHTFFFPLVLPFQHGGNPVSSTLLGSSLLWCTYCFFSPLVIWMVMATPNSLSALWGIEEWACIALHHFRVEKGRKEGPELCSWVYKSAFQQIVGMAWRILKLIHYRETPFICADRQTSAWLS